MIGTKTVYVMFDFGSFVYLEVKIYENKTLEECIKLRDEHIEAYFNEDKKEWQSL